MAARKKAARKRTARPETTRKKGGRRRADRRVVASTKTSEDIAAEIIVGFEPKIVTSMNFEPAVATIGRLIDRLCKNLPADLVRSYMPKSAKSGPVPAFCVIRPRDATLTAARLQKQRKDFPGVAYFERNAEIAPSAFNDLLARQQWALKTIGVEDEWTVTPTGTTILAIVDSGLRRIDGSLPEDIANVYPASFCQPAGLYPDGIDQYGHGTMLAGTMAAVPNNNVGLASPIPAAWNIALMPIKFFGTDAPPDVANAAAAIRHAAYKGARVINASWHVSLADKDKKVLRDAIKEANDPPYFCLVVAAAGNDGTDNEVYPTYPANYGNPGTYPGLKVLTVSATDKDDYKAPFSNYSAKLVDIAAPGVRLLTTGQYLTGPARYPAYSGTSAAAALVSAGATLIYALNPDWKPGQVQDYLKASAAKLPAKLGNVCQGGNRLDLKRAVYGPLAVTAPVGGTDLHVGTLTAVTWSVAFDFPKFKKVTVEFSKDDGATWTTLGTPKIDSNLLWTPGNGDLTAQGRIRVTPVGGNFPAMSGRFRVL